MKKTFALLAIMIGFGTASINVDDGSIAEKIRFEAWMQVHKKTFETPTVMKKAYYGWLSNDKIIQQHNAGDSSYTLGHNEYSHLTNKEFAAKFTMNMPKPMMRKNNKNVDYSLSAPERVAAAPDAIDWTQKGAVTPIKNQKQCGSCWAFSTTGSVEGRYQIANGTLKSFSEQELVSCDHVDDGCKGGLMDNAFKYIEKNGICGEASYPYVSGDGHAPACKSCSAEATVTAFTDVPPHNEDALKAAVAEGPVSVAVEADKSAFQLYKTGVMDSKMCGHKLDHGVLAVGYGTMSGKDYWKVKNSWGLTWGESGYILLGRGENICGISQQASYPTGVKPAGGPHPPAPPISHTTINASTWHGLSCEGKPSSVEHVVSNTCRKDGTTYSLWNCVPPCGPDAPKGCLAEYTYVDANCTTLANTDPFPNPNYVPANHCDEQSPFKHFRIDCVVS